MKKLANVYKYERIYEDVSKDDNYKLTYQDDYLYSEGKNRYYKTKMKPVDLPEYYCDVYNGYNHFCISTKNIVHMKYNWVKENHFMKDSSLRISYTGKINPEYNDGNCLFFVTYSNVDAILFGNSIFKFLAYANKYSNYDLSEIKNQIMQQCDWLQHNEPAFAPDTDDFSQWFDELIKKYQNNE